MLKYRILVCLTVSAGLTKNYFWHNFGDGKLQCPKFIFEWYFRSFRVLPRATE